jgi:CHAT domain-containing protein/Tfp pilus assembly protein PilF
MRVFGEGRASLSPYSLLKSQFSIPGKPTMSSMSVRFPSVLILILLLPVASHAQSTSPLSIATEAELLSALLSVKTGDDSAALALLRGHKELVTPSLCDSVLQAVTMASALGNSARSMFLCEVAKATAIQLEDKKLLGRVLYKIGRTYFEQDKIKLAIEEYLRSRATLEQAGSRRDLIYVLSELGTLHIYAADYVAAEQYSQQSLALAASLKNSNEPAGASPDDYGIAFAWSNLGQVAQWKGDYDTALDNFKKALALWKELIQRAVSYAGNVADALVSIAHVYQAAGDHVQCLDYLTQAKEVAKTLFPQGRMAAVLNDIGVLYLEQGDYAKASESLHESLRIFTRLNNRREIARNLLNIAVIDHRQGRYEAALRGFEESLRRAQEIEAAEITVAAQEGLGSVYQAQGNYSMALESFEKAWSPAQAIGDKVRLTELLWRKGQVFYSQRDYARSGAAASSAADLAKQLRSPLMTYFALTLKGKSHRAQKTDAAASESFLGAIDAVERMRDQIAGAEKEQQLFFETRISPYHEMVSMLVEQRRPAEALGYAERAKGRVLLDVLRGGRININRSLGQSEQSEERRLYREMVSVNAQIRIERMRERTDESRTTALETRLEKARNEYEAFQTALYAAHPELKARRGLFPSFAVNDIAAAIPDAGTAVLEYVVTNEQTFLFVLARDSTRRGKVDVKVFPIDVKRSDLSLLVEKFRNLLSTNHPGFRQIGLDLYDLLVKPARVYVEGKTTVCIVPDGPLWNLPFQALQTAGDKYLLELYTIYYAPSLQVLHEMRKRSVSLDSPPLGKSRRNHTASSSRALASAQLYAVGNPTFGGEAIALAQALRNAPFVALPETEKEVQTLSAEVYGPNASVVRIGAAAREETVKAEIRGYRVLHFATHGVLDDKNPLYSYLVLASGTDSKEDGLLEAWELMQMDLKAELVVLSACDTARGRVGDGEGMIGFTWALFVAGVPTMIASQWRVPSESTTKLMVAFHKTRLGYNSGKKISNAEAWRQAALGMIRDPRYRMKPYYWAGFVVVGDAGR